MPDRKGPNFKAAWGSAGSLYSYAAYVIHHFKEDATREEKEILESAMRVLYDDRPKISTEQKLLITGFVFHAIVSRYSTAKSAITPAVEITDQLIKELDLNHGEKTSISTE